MSVCLRREKRRLLDTSFKSSSRSYRPYSKYYAAETSLIAVQSDIHPPAYWYRKDNYCEQIGAKWNGLFHVVAPPNLGSVVQNHVQQ